MDTLNKTHFLNWLAVYPGGRDAFAEKIGYSLGTVNNWCSGRSIPQRVQRQILELMQDTAPGNSVVIPMTVAEFTRVDAASQAAGYESLESFARDALIEKARKIRERDKLRLNEEAKASTALADETPEQLAAAAREAVRSFRPDPIESHRSHSRSPASRRLAPRASKTPTARR